MPSYHFNYLNMKKITAFLLITACIAMSYNCFAQNSSVFSSELPELNSTEDMSNFVTLDKGKCLVRMSHNDEGVFVQAIVKDKALQQKFIMQGLTIYLDLSGKKNKKYGVVYPKANPEMMRSAMQSGRSLGEVEKEDRRPRGGSEHPLNIAPIINQLAFESGILTSNKDEYYLDNTKTRISINDEDLVFSCSIPYSMIGKKIGKKNLIAVGLSCETEKLSGDGPQGGMPPSGGPMGGGPMGGGGMSPGGGGMPPSGMRPGGMGSRESMGEMMKAYNQWAIFSTK